MSLALSNPPREVPRYLLAGAVNTLASWLCYLGLLQLVPYPAAYTVAFAFGILLSFLINSRFVFGVPLRLRRLLPYPGVYLAQYVAGYGVLWFAVERLGLPDWAGPLVALASTVPLGFVLTRFVLVGTTTGRHQPS